jgi:parallel beta-helix repeat protein
MFRCRRCGAQLAFLAAATAASGAGALLQQHEIFVSPSGSDVSSGASIDVPVATLRRARDLLRGAPRPATVHVATGHYFLGNESLSLGPLDGGGVLWEGAANGSSVIHAGTRIVGWQKHGDTGAYRAPWTGRRFFALTEGRHAAALARHPDPGSGYIALTQKTGDTVGWVPNTVPNFTCTEPHQCQAYLQCNYFAEIHNVALGSVNLSASTLKYEQEPHCNMHMGMGGVMLLGALEFLSAPGEFAISGGYVYYRPFDSVTPIEDLIIVASIPERAVEFVGSSSTTLVKDITLSNLTFVGSGANYSWQIAWDNGPTSLHGEGYQSNYIMTAMQQGQIYFENASSITVEGCELLAAGQSTVWMQGYAQNNNITGNIIRESGLCAVYLSGYCRASSSEDRRRRRLTTVADGTVAADTDFGGGRERARLREAYHSRECVYTSFSTPEEAYVSRNNTIAHNYMVNGNLAVGGYAGIYLYESGENTIRNNVIKRYARDAIGLFGSELAFGEIQDGVRGCCKTIRGSWLEELIADDLT